MSVRLDGKAVSAHFKSEMALEVKKMIEEGQRAPHLAAILVGEDGGSKTYIEAKDRACKEVGFDSTILRFPDTISEEELLSEVDRINLDDNIDGLIVQLPLPSHIDENKVTQKILPKKDVDGFHDINMGKLAKGDHSGYISATPLGITMLLKYYNIDTSGKNAVVIGRSNIVGRPMSILLSESSITGNATVTLCHSRTKNLEEICSRADIIVAAIGKPFFVKENMVKEGAIVIDVGTTRLEDSTRERGWRLAGDIDYTSVKDKASMITPVPGGVGPMTITGLLSNTLKARQMK
ncbi:MAG: bifunctional 5,10-methylenetetrahydrofolate dehydrogenase/5,10-methenyltetrahydrofolate cyclohydrolase [Bacteroidia bacterium]|jgi:methylenetetrahydrofolate dehydrogenase (NADP+) / methenyltetrahydrofolate cyclohydrolase|nr:bifunctional 5,10-methylenetetrahydrofolate dehydrogenase/5,10-methenyltetrahydrofolate cyclohydrolase [Bacteroidia bacterium]